MNFILFSIFAICLHETTFVEAKIDTDILLVIESSYQNQNYDILCALREALSSLSGQGNFSQREVNLTLNYIDLLHDCFANKLSSTTKIVPRDMSVLEEGKQLIDCIIKIRVRTIYDFMYFSSFSLIFLRYCRG